MSTRDAKYNELHQLRRELRGISPKVSIYKKLQARIEQLKTQLDGENPDLKIFKKDRILK